MPLYCFVCENCEERFEILASIKQKEAGLEPVCPNCQSMETTQVVTAGLALHGQAVTGLSRFSCSSNVGPGCCGS